MTGLFFVVAEMMGVYGLKPISHVKRPGVRVVYFDMKYADRIKRRWEQVGSTLGWEDVCALIVDDNGVGLIVRVPEEFDKEEA